MYASNDDRDAEIEETVRTLDLAALVEDAITSSARLTEAFWTCTADLETPYTRVPGGEVFPLRTRWAAGAAPRWRSTTATWTAATPPRSGRWTSPGSWSSSGRTSWPPCDGGGPSMVLSSTDSEGLWKLGRGSGPEIHGAVGDLAWWLVGRGGGRGLTCSSGDLPVLGRWR